MAATGSLTVADWLARPESEIETLIAIARRALDQAGAGGADQAEVSVSSSLARESGVRLGDIEHLEEARDRGLRVTVYAGQCSGTASTGDLRPEVIDQCVQRALDIARHTQRDRAAGLAEPGLIAAAIEEMNHGGLVDLDLWHPDDIALDVLAERAMAMEKAGREADPRIANSEGASVSFEASLSVYGNSLGFMGSRKSTSFSQSCVLIAQDEQGIQRDYDWDSARRWSELNAPEQTGRHAAERTVRRLGARRVPTGPVPVLFAPQVAKGLLGHLVSAASGSNLYRRSSFLLDALGEAVLPDAFSLIEDPRQPGGPGSAHFDADGVATRAQPLVAGGVLSRYVLGSYSARRLGLETTANAGGVRNLRLEGPLSSVSDLLAEVGTGLLVTEVMGQGVNLVNGDYSRGAAGFWIENGEVAWPVEEITIAGNLRRMLLGLTAAGDDIDRRHNIQTGSLLIDRMTVAGQS
jgi:PmbA protein